MDIHPTAIIDRRAEIHDSVAVGPFCVIDGDVRVEAGCRLYHGVYLTGWTHIGEKCELHPAVIVGHAPQDVKYKGERTFCRVGRGTILREHVTIHRGTKPESHTVIGDECFLLGGTHVAHNCRVGNRVTLINNVLLAGHVEIGDGATLGGAVGVHQFVRIGELAMIAGNARVTQDVVPFALLGPDGRVAGLNRIGLRRAGFSQSDVMSIRDAYRVLLDGGVPHAERIERLALAAKTSPARRLLEFMRAQSKRGLAGPSRRRNAAASAEP
jgi:UDP-N-acetylglucosamine acyltransferase